MNKNKLAMIVQPMYGKDDHEIEQERNDAINMLSNAGFDVLNSYFKDDWSNPEEMKRNGVKNIPISFLARSIEQMSKVDAIYLCNGWSSARGCCIEYQIAKAYGLQIIGKDFAIGQRALMDIYDDASDAKRAMIDVIVAQIRNIIKE